MKKFNLLTLLVCVQAVIVAQTISTFENLSLAPNTFWDGSDQSGGFNSGNAYFINEYDTTYQIWNGFTYSNMKDSTTAGFLNQNSAITAIGHNGSANYVVANDYGFAKVRISGNAAGKMLHGVYVTNATYTYLSMRDGDMFAKKFGGVTGNDADWLKLSVIGWESGAPVPNTVEMYLADFRFADNSQDYLLRSWQWFNLQPLGNVDSIQFLLTSSDTGAFGMNTPAYFALDDFTTADLANTAPVANNDEVSVSYNTDTLVDVISNDLDFTATPFTVRWVSGPEIPGAVASLQNGKILYQPAPGILAVDTVTYSVCDAAGECDTAQLLVRVGGINSVNDNALFQAIVYPNPFSEFLQIRLDTDAQVLLQDMNGSLVLETKMGRSFEMNTGELPSGIYFLHITAGSESLVKKLVKN
ncbi:MAG: DUF4465 domain-containing protein [Bacteroidetes bacterium]|nr:DUF4465 domain-containing protein [Bacteroidota bacterium]